MGGSSRLAAAAVVIALAVTACSSDGGSSPATSQTPSSVVAAGELPMIDAIGVAMKALDAKLGGPQQYFEVNATSQLVNLFVSLDNGSVAQPWVYLDGALSSTEGQPASGGTFAAASVDFDPKVVLAPLLTQMPGITIESFYIHGDGQGNVLYGVLAQSAKGGGLDIVVGADGAVKSVDPVN